ncbi:MAG: hypothetical protein IT179_08195 [Acidobacteria bacterium]|nr:hypothetical protein [Acidobacteriota bacterium]
MTTPPTSAAPPRPTVDEWGVYDPQQAGLAALFTRLAGVPEPRADGIDLSGARILEPRPVAGSSPGLRK